MNVVDKLIIELGFDPTEFRKGTTETTKQVDTLGRKVNSVNQSMGKSITDLANKFAVAFLGWRGLQEAISVNKAEQQMGFLAANTGVAIEKVNALGEALRVNTGGGAESAFNALRKITQEQTNLRTNATSSWLVPLSRFPTDKFKGLTDNLLKARDPLEVFLEVADSLQTIAAGAGGRADAFNLGAQLGFDENAVNFMLQGRKAIEAQVATQEKRYKLSKAEADQARATSASFEQLKITGEHALMRLLNVLRPFIIEFTSWLDKVSNDPKTINMAKDALIGLGKAIQAFVDIVTLAYQKWTDVVGKGATSTFASGFADELHRAVTGEQRAPGEAAGPIGMLATSEGWASIGLRVGEIAHGMAELVTRAQFGGVMNATANAGGGPGANVTIGTVVVHSQATSVKGAGAEVGPAVSDSIKRNSASIVKNANQAQGGMR